MTNTKTTKRALLASVLSIVICLTMLIGSTFAWFTDSATTGVNVIKSGNLEIGFEYADGTEAIETAKWENAEGAEIFNYEKWEPGYTVAKHIKITNKGTLAFKYELDFMLSSPVGKLAEVIDVYFADPAVQVADRTDATNLEKVKYVGTLKEFLEDTAIDPENGYLLEDDSATVTIVLKMQESAGNIYQNETVGEGLTVAIFATQYTYESDSFDNQYDANAPTLVMIDDKQYDNIAAAIAAAEDNATIKLSGKFELPNNIPNKTLTFTTTDADNKALIAIKNNTVATDATLTFDGVTVKGQTGNGDWHTVQLNNAKKATYKNCTIIDLITTYCPSDFIDCEFKNNSTKDADWYSVFDYASGDVNITNCTFNTRASKAVKIFSEGKQSATLNVTNCKFNGSFFDKAAIEIDTTHTEGTYTVNISNCTTNKYYTELWSDKFANSKAVVNVDGKRQIKIANGLYFDDNATYTVVSATGMFNFAKQVNESNKTFSGKTVVLENDIDLENKTWTPIGQTGATQFLGTFDGNGHTIKNLKIDSSAQTGGTYSSGLFGWIERQGEDAGYLMAVKNLTIDNANVKGNHNVAVIAGYLIGTIDNCHVKNATVVCNHANNDACGDKAGVIAGIAAEAKALIKDCTAADSTVSAGRDAGQIVGACIVGKVENCKATNVTVSATGDCTGNNINNELIGRTN